MYKNIDVQAIFFYVCLCHSDANVVGQCERLLHILIVFNRMTDNIYGLSQRSTGAARTSTLVKVSALYLNYIMQGFCVLPANCPIGVKLLIFKSYLFCGIITTAYWIPNAGDRVPLVVVLRTDNIMVFSYQPLGKLSSLRASNCSEATSTNKSIFHQQNWAQIHHSLVVKWSYLELRLLSVVSDSSETEFQ